MPRVFRICLAISTFVALLFSFALPAQTGPEEPEEPEERAAALERIRVLGTPPERFLSEPGDALTGFGVDYLDLPRSIEVIPEQILLDRKVTTLTEALQNASGITLSDGFGGTNDDFLIRGFRRNQVYRNGFRLGSNFRVNTTNLDRIEVIKGPASITFGQVEPGGLVNIETKRPLDESRYYAEGRAARYDDYFGLVDISQPVEAMGGGLRINASMQRANSFRDFSDIDRDFVSLSASAKPFSGTTLEFNYEYRDESRPLDRGTVTVPDGQGGRSIADLPRSRRLGEPFERFAVELNLLDYSIRQELGAGWTVEGGMFHEFSDADDFQARPLGLLPDGTLFRRADGSRARDIDVLGSRLQFAGEARTGPIKHRIAIGGDYRKSSENRLFAVGETTSDFNIFDPVFGNLSPEPLIEIPASSDSEEYGIYIQDLIELTPSLMALAGVRFDEVEVESFFAPPVDNVTDTGFQSEISPQFGLTWRALDEISIYASYAEGFLPNSAVDETTGETFDPEESDQLEGGIKGEFVDGRIQTGLAVYRIDKENVVRVVDGVAKLVDGQRSEGVEVTASGRPLPGMFITASYAYTDAEILSGPDQGNQPRNVAEQVFNFWGSYEVPSGPLYGLGTGVGVSLFEDRFGDDANTWNLGAYELVDFSVWYNLPLPGIDVLGPGEARVQFSVKNLFDEEYFPASGGDLRVNVGQPRTYIGSLAFTF